jgi:hypothetical protein
MLRWDGRLLNAAQLRAGIDPGKCVVQVRALDVIERLDGGNFRPDRGPHARRSTRMSSGATCNVDDRSLHHGN